MEQLVSHWMDFDKIWYLSAIRKYTEKIQFSFKSDNNNWNFTWRRFHSYDNISLNSCYNEKCVRQKLRRKSKHILCSVAFFPENRALYNFEKWGGARGRKWQYGGALNAGLVRLQARKHKRTPCSHTYTRVRTHAHTQKYVILFFHSNIYYENAPCCYVMRTLPFLFSFRTIHHIMSVNCRQTLEKLWLIMIMIILFLEVIMKYQCVMEKQRESVR